MLTYKQCGGIRDLNHLIIINENFRSLGSLCQSTKRGRKNTTNMCEIRGEMWSGNGGGRRGDQCKEKLGRRSRKKLL